MAAANLTTSAPILKTLYPQSEIAIEMADNMAGYGLLSKHEEMEGQQIQVALRYATTAGRSRTFSNAQANKGASKLAKFLVTRVRDYSAFSIDGETILAGKSNKGAIVNTLTTEVDAAMDAIRLNTGRSIYRNLGGAIGAIASTSTVASTSITLNDTNTAIFFEVGQVVNAASTDGTTGALRSGSAVLTAVDHINGTLTTGSNWSAQITGISASSNTTFGDYLFIDGDFGQSVWGFDTWVPATAPSPGDSFAGGLDRSVDTLRLAGIRAVNTAGLAPEESLQKGLQQAFKQGARPKVVLMNDTDMEGLVLSLGSRKVDVETENEIGVGYQGVKITTLYGSAEVYADPCCQQGTAWGIDPSTWNFDSLEAFPMFLDEDTIGRLLRENTADAYEGRIGGYYNLWTDRPGKTVRIPL